MSSCLRSGCFFAFKKFVGLDLIQLILYLKSFSLLRMSFAVKIPWEFKTITPLGLIILSYSFQSFFRSITLSHLFCVVPYGRSDKIISIEASGIFFSTLRQSPFITSL